MGIKSLKHMAKKENTLVDIAGKQIPLQIIREKRKSSRVSVGKSNVILRMPSGVFSPPKDKAISWVKEWLENLMKEKPGVLERIAIKAIPKEEILVIGERSYRIIIADTQPYATHRLNRDGDELTIFFAKKSDDKEKKRGRRLLLNLVVVNDFLPGLQKRVAELNQKHFQQHYNKVSMRYTVSKWGSCSSVGNISFSSRLMMAPQEVIDYVIIHELAHLIEANHSSRFWALVQKAMPDYRKQVQWLSEYGHSCNF